jgi:glutamate-1-semialdehyde 2,1-aminomutase/spore coat polysaccharide biosynthesis protein SpsF
MQQNPVIEHLWQVGQQLQTGFNTMVAEFGLGEYTQCIGMHPRTFIQFQDPQGHIPMLHLKSLFQQEVAKRGIIFNGNHMVTYSHSQADIDYTLEVYRAALEVFARAMDSQSPLTEWLDGPPIQPIF